jgi:hypothetical protein
VNLNATAVAGDLQMNPHHLLAWWIL